MVSSVKRFEISIFTFYDDLYPISTIISSHITNCKLKADSRNGCKGAMGWQKSGKDLPAVEGGHGGRQETDPDVERETRARAE